MLVGMGWRVEDLFSRFSAFHIFSLLDLASYLQLMGLAVYNSIILDIHFPASTYKKLLSPAVVPYNNPGAEVGRAPVSHDDLAQVNPVSHS